MPFLPKVITGVILILTSIMLTMVQILSIQKALPLQIHPDKELASRLHKQDPEKYTDDNHKPEIAVALGKFEVFAGWKPNAEIESLFALGPLKRFLPEKHSPFNNETLKYIGRTILEASDDVIATTQEQLAKVPRESLGDQAYILDLLPRLQKQYSKQDPGNLVALLSV